MATLCDTRIIRAAELAERLGISRVTLWRWERDGRIPKKVVVGPNVSGWVEAKIEEWWAAKSEGRKWAETATPEEAEQPEPAAPKLRVVTTQAGS